MQEIEERNALRHLFFISFTLFVFLVGSGYCKSLSNEVRIKESIHSNTILGDSYNLNEKREESLQRSRREIDSLLGWGSAAGEPASVLLRRIANDIMNSETSEGVSSSVFEPAQTCGYRPFDDHVKRRRVVAGLSAQSRWPWQIQLFNKSSGVVSCGGSLISTEYVLTAAHCVSNGWNYPNEVIIRVGDLDRNRDEGFEQDFQIQCVYVHSGYSVYNTRPTLLGSTIVYDNDIALIKLKTSPSHRIRISSEVMPICLPRKNEFRPGKTCYVTGWGYTSFYDYLFDNQPDTLQEAAVPLISQSKCRAIPKYHEKVNSNKKQCAGHTDGNLRQDTCKRDSGGPLSCKGTDGRYKLWGITSEGENAFCLESPTTAEPGIYTRVDRFLPWIQKKMASHACPRMNLLSGRPDVMPLDPE